MDWKLRFAIVAVLALVMNRISNVSSGTVVDPTTGFTDLPFNKSHYKIHKPYDVPETQRYSFIDGVHKLWVYSTDNSFSPGSPTNPRTEIMINGYNYTWGIWQLEGQVFVPKVTNGACILQVFGSGDGLHNTSLMLDVYNGSLMYYSFAVIVPNILDRWFKVNVIDDMEDGSLRVFIDGVVLFQVPGHGGVSHYFKLGVYGQNNESYYMESRWKGIRVLYKNASDVRSYHINN